MSDIALHWIKNKDGYWIVDKANRPSSLTEEELAEYKQSELDFKADLDNTLLNQLIADYHNVKKIKASYCGLCRMRIFFANEQLNYLKFGDYQVEDDSKLEHDIAFWSKVKEYWEKKLLELKE